MNPMTAGTGERHTPEECEPVEKYGWQKRYDELHADPTKPMIGPWHWEIHDYSMATLCGGGEDAIVGFIMAIGPCPACAERGKDSGWEWGRCMVPSEANARLIAAAPKLLAALQYQERVLTQPNTPKDEEHREATRLRRAAIAKATAAEPIP